MLDNFFEVCNYFIPLSFKKKFSQILLRKNICKKAIQEVIYITSNGLTFVTISTLTIMLKKQ